MLLFSNDKASAHLYTLVNNIYTRKNSSTNIYLFIVNNSNIRKRCKICLKLRTKTPERRSSVLVIKFEQILHF